MSSLQRTGRGDWRRHQPRRQQHDELKTMLFWLESDLPAGQYAAFRATLPEEYYPALVAARARFIQMRQEASIPPADCTCTPISNACPKCVEANRVRYGDEVPVEGI